mgnify:CR=1 FL=1
MQLAINTLMKKIIALLIILLPLLGFGRTDSNAQYIHKKLLRATAGFSPGIMTQQKITNIYIIGNLEYYIHRKISLRGESYYFLNTINSNKPFVLNHKIFAGTNYHFRTNNHLDPYIGIHPGAAITQTLHLPVACVGFCPQNFTEPTKSSVSTNPLFSVSAGINYYFQKLFHLYADVKYNYGKHLSDMPTPQSLSEFNFTFGLGWNLF